MPKIQLTDDKYERILRPERLAQIIGIDLEILMTVAQSPGQYYRSFDRFKKYDDDGMERWRHIDNPTDILKEIQSRITKRILSPIAYRMPQYLTGGMPERSTMKNARPHINKEAILEMDLEKCFDSIGNKKIHKVLISLGHGRKVCSLMTKLLTFQNRLPQGSPASTVLCNMALANMASEIEVMAKAKRMDYSQYIDDVTASGERSLVTGSIKEIIDSITRAGVRLNRSKTKILSSGQTQEVTGVGVNKLQTVTRAKYQKIRLRILETSVIGSPVNERVLKSIYGQIQSVEQLNKSKGQKLRNFADIKLKDLRTFKGPKLDTTKIRRCSSYHRAH